MMEGAAIVSVIASLGWLFLNFKALQADELSFRKKAGMAVAWAIIIGGLAVILSRFAP
jgi:hypothetical protein